MGEAIGEEKTSPTAELVQGPCGADPLTAQSRSSQGTQRCYTSWFTASFKQGGKAALKLNQVNCADKH